MFTSVVRQAAAQPIVDTVKAIQKLNERYYRTLGSLDANGESYTFTNVIKWKIVDRELQDQLKEILVKPPFNVKPDEYRIDDIYLFCAPVSSDRVEPFHILLDGEILEKKKGKKKSSGGFGEFGDEEESGIKSKKAFQGKMVVQLMHRNPALYENINIVQGDNVEIPGEIVPTGSQLIKDAQLRYAMSRMFDGFYNKQVILDAQRSLYGLPTAAAQFEEYKLADAQSSIGADTTQANIDSTLSTSLPEEGSTFEKMTRKERTFDLSVEHLRVYASKNLGFELRLGNPEVGLPFWTSGQTQLWFNMRNMIGTESDFKLGLSMPVSIYGSQFGTEDKLLWNARKMSGSWGGSVSAYFAAINFFSEFNLPLAFNFTINPSGADSNASIIKNGLETTITSLNGNTVTLAAGKTFYRNSMIAQIYIPTIIQLDLHSFVQVSVGLGIQNVQQSYIPSKYDADPNRNPNPTFTSAQVGTMQDLHRVSVPVNPHIAFEYVNHKAAKFGLGAMFDHLFTFSGWIEIVEDRLRIETSYTSPLIRDAKPWEPANFFQITPRIYF